MSDSRTRELIQAELDGVLDESGRAELERALGGSAEARRFREEMQRLIRTLEAMPREEPPEELHRRIVRSIELPRRSRWREWLGPLNASALLRYGVAGAAGAVLTLGVIASRDSLDGPADFSQMAGTIARGAELPTAGRVDSFSVTSEGARAEGVLSRTGDGWLLQLDLEGAVPLELAVDLAGTGLGFAGVVRSDAGLQGLDWSGQTLAGRITGPERLTLLLQGAGDGGAIGVSLAGDGMKPVEAQLATKRH